MSRLSSFQALIKGLTLVPIVVLLYYTDLPGWLSSMYAAHFLALFVGALTLLLLFTGLKRRVLSAYLELGEGNLLLGLFFLAAWVAMYLYGFFSADLLWFHYESLVLLVTGYVMLRLDARVVKTLGPLILM